MKDIALIVNNQFLLASVISWVLAQVLKVILVLVTQRRIDFRRLVGYGGMPSGHSASMMALSVGVGMTVGWDSALFAVTFAVTLVIMYDAAGLRRAAGKQASALNRILDVLSNGSPEEKRRIFPENLKELLGHTPVQVLAGAALGVVVALLVC